MKIKNLSKLFLCLLPVIVMFTGCSSSDNTQNTEVQIEDFEIGEKTESSKTINVKNDTDAGIIGLSAWPVGEAFASHSILQQDQIIDPGSEAKWNFEVSSDNPVYYIQIYLQDGTNFILRDLDVNSIPDSGTISVKYKDGIGYVEYEKTDKTLVDTYKYQKSQEDQPLEENLDDDGLIGVPVDD